MKTRKSYRLSPRAMRALDRLHEILPEWPETDIVEAALECLLHSELLSIELQQKAAAEAAEEPTFRAEGRSYYAPDDDLAEAYDLPPYNWPEL